MLGCALIQTAGSPKGKMGSNTTWTQETRQCYNDLLSLTNQLLYTSSNERCFRSPDSDGYVYSRVSKTVLSCGYKYLVIIKII